MVQINSMRLKRKIVSGHNFHLKSDEKLKSFMLKTKQIFTAQQNLLFSIFLFVFAILSRRIHAEKEKMKRKAAREKIKIRFKHSVYENFEIRFSVQYSKIFKNCLQHK